MIQLKIADGIEMIEISMNLMGGESIICPTLIWDDDTVILIDAGTTGSLSEIKKAMKDAGVPFERLDKIVVTHQDIDHIGGIKDILEELPEVKVLAHEEDKPYIQGEKKLVRLNSIIMGRISALPEEERKRNLDLFENTHAPVDITLADGEELADCGGIVIIHTPGHTPGHICLYHKPSKTLIVGDTMRVFGGQLIGPQGQPLNEKDMKKAINSLKKFEKYDIENIIAYHGGLFNGDSNQRVKELNNKEV
jgi:glyoxylase-like metal-dependent hydrolase (beta-lactamase superfamily II)